MYPLLMSHPLHGRMNVYDEGDKKKHEGLGWVVAEEATNVAEEATPKKRGRPPKVK